MAYLRQQLAYHRFDMSRVRPEVHTTRGAEGQSVYLNSQAGLIRFSTKSLDELCRFRDDVLNRFSMLAERHRRGESVADELFALYRYARGSYRVRYSGNLNTRMRAVLHALGIHNG